MTDDDVKSADEQPDTAAAAGEGGRFDPTPGPAPPPPATRRARPAAQQEFGRKATGRLKPWRA